MLTLPKVTDKTGAECWPNIFGSPLATSFSARQRRVGHYGYGMIIYVTYIAMKGEEDSLGERLSSDKKQDKD